MGFLSFLEKPFRTGKSAADRAQGFANDAANKAASSQLDLAQEQFDLFKPLSEKTVATQGTALQRLSDLLAGAGDTREIPGLPEVIGGDESLAFNRAGEAAQNVRSQFGNSLRNRTRALGSSLSGSGNLGSGLSGVNLSEDRAAGLAFNDRFNQIQDQQTQDVNRQLEERERLKFNFNLLEQNRPFQDQLSASSLILGQGATNPASGALSSAFAAPANVAQNNANFRASQVKPGFGTQLISAGAGAVLGGSGTLSNKLFG